MNEIINIADYNYELPEERIAQNPLNDRASSKLLIYNKGVITDSYFRNIPDYIPDNAFLIFNNTKVINARIFFKRKTGAKIEIFCLEPIGAGVEKTFEKISECEWDCLVGNASKWRDEVLEKEFTIGNKTGKLFAEKKEVFEDSFIIKFNWEGGYSFSDIIHEAGSTPLPPYIKRKAEISDENRYQTVFAEVEGSVAAPTAGLHFTMDVLTNLKNKNINYDFITLNVGAGTFKPVKSDNIYEHKMHREIFTVKRSFINNLLYNARSPKVAVGTTSVRTLESLYWLGILPNKAEKGNFVLEQWEIYDYMESDLPEFQDAIENLIKWMDKNGTDFIEGSTSLMIIPGYKFKIINVLITNFHLPSSTLLLLVSAFAGSDWKNIYNYALENDFRFLSYGDSSIITP